MLGNAVFGNGVSLRVVDSTITIVSLLRIGFLLIIWALFNPPLQLLSDTALEFAVDTSKRSRVNEGFASDIFGGVFLNISSGVFESELKTGLGEINLV